MVQHHRYASTTQVLLGIFVAAQPVLFSQDLRHGTISLDELAGRWVSDAEIADVAFTSHPKTRQMNCRLVVRRAKRLQPLASDGDEQGELFSTHRHHAFITNSTLPVIEADERHRDQAIVEQSSPSSRLAAGAPAVRAVRRERRPGRARGHRVQPRPRRRRLVLHLPRHWPWAPGWEQLWDTATGPPPAATT